VSSRRVAGVLGGAFGMSGRRVGMLGGTLREESFQQLDLGFKNPVTVGSLLSAKICNVLALFFTLLSELFTLLSQL
jgi:hypothetical protein